MSEQLTADALILDDHSDEQDQRALLYVCGMQARDVDDARELIDALGLNGRRMRSSSKWPPVAKDVCGNGHPRSRDNVYPSGACKACSNERSRKHYYQQKAAAHDRDE
jgi:hypothetical protein